MYIDCEHKNKRNTQKKMSVEKLLRELGLMNLSDDPFRSSATAFTPFDEMHKCLHPLGAPPSQAGLGEVLKSIACRVQRMSHDATTFYRLFVRVAQKREAVVVDRTLKDVHILLRDVEEEFPFLCLPTAAGISCPTACDETHLEWLLPYVAVHVAEACCFSPALFHFFFSTEKPYVRKGQLSLSGTSIYRSSAPEFLAPGGGLGVFWYLEGKSAAPVANAPVLTPQDDVMVGLAEIDPDGVLGNLYLTLCSQGQAAVTSQTLFESIRTSDHDLHLSTLAFLPALGMAYHDDAFMMTCPVSSSEDSMCRELALRIARKLRSIRHLSLSVHMFFRRVVDVSKECKIVGVEYMKDTQKRLASGIASSNAAPADSLDRSAVRLGRWEELCRTTGHCLFHEVCKVRNEMQSELLVTAKLIAEWRSVMSTAVKLAGEAALDKMPPEFDICISNPPPPPPPKKPILRLDNSTPLQPTLKSEFPLVDNDVVTNVQSHVDSGRYTMQQARALLEDIQRQAELAKQDKTTVSFKEHTHDVTPPALEVPTSPTTRKSPRSRAKDTEIVHHHVDPKVSRSQSFRPTVTDKKGSVDPTVSRTLSSPSLSPKAKGARSANTDYRARVMAMYQKYQPDKLATVDTLMAKAAGEEDVLIQRLVEKYGPEPVVGDNKGRPPVVDIDFFFTTTEPTSTPAVPSVEVSPAQTQEARDLFKDWSADWVQFS